MTPRDVIAGAERSVAQDLARSIREVLGEDLVGIYLSGSAATGGFDTDVSDLDLVAVTAAPADRIDLAGLKAMHGEFIRERLDWVDRIEAVYVGRVTLASFRTSTDSMAVISPGEPFHIRSDAPVRWLQNWYLIREDG